MRASKAKRERRVASTSCVVCASSSGNTACLGDYEKALVTSTRHRLTSAAGDWMCCGTSSNSCMSSSCGAKRDDGLRLQKQQIESALH